MGKYEVQIVKCSLLNARKYPNATTSSLIVVTLPVGTKFTSSKQQNGWYYNDKHKGWMSGKYIKVLKNLSPTAKPVKTTSKKDDEAARKAAYQKAKKNQLAREKAEREEIQKVIQTGSGGVGLRTDIKKASIDAQPVETTQYDLHNPAINYGKKTSELLFNNEGLTPGGGIIGKFESNYSEFESILTKIHKNHSIEPQANSVNWNNWNKFNRFRLDFPDSYLSKTVGYVFFTRPALNIFTDDGKKLRGGLATDPFWTSMRETQQASLKSLTSHWSNTHDFHNRLTNYALSFEVPDEVLKTEEHGESLIGHKMMYGISNVESNTAGTFTVNYKEDPTYSIYNIHKIWVEYITRIHKGKILCNPKHRYLKILDYASSVYFFLCAGDGETILFWSKYFGVFPTSVPSSGASWTKGSSPKTIDHSVNYAYSLKEDMDVTTLFEFNRLNRTSGTTGNFNYEPIYNPHIMRSGLTFTGSPFVQSQGSGYNKHYKLRFRK